MVRFLGAVRDAIVNFWNTRVHFIELHYLYIGVSIFISSGLLYLQPGTNWNYVDALFMATTFNTNTGLNTITMSQSSDYQVSLYLINSFLTSHILVSYIVLMVRKHYFSKRFNAILRFNKERRIREENRRKEKMKRQQHDIELGIKKQCPSITSVTTSPGAPESEHTTTKKRPSSFNRRRQSFSSVASSPVRGVRARNTRQRSMSGWMTNPSDVHAFFRELRREQQDVLDKREAEVIATMEHEQLERHPSTPMHPFDDGVDSTDAASDPIGQRRMNNNESPSPTIENEDAARQSIASTGGGGANGGAGGIAFANNVEQQREIARRRFERERRFEGLMEVISRDMNPNNDLPLTDTVYDSDQSLEDDDEDDDEFFQEILRQPIDKSQLTRKQRYRLGGVEYHALDILSYIVPIYYVGIIVAASFAFRVYVAVSPYAQDVLLNSNDNRPVNAWLFAFFFGNSSLNNLGVVPLDASLVPFQSTPFPLIVCMILILIGNTAYAILLRFIIWSMLKLTPEHKVYRREALQYLLDHPRRCYTTLFPATQTWWLLIILIIITLIEIVCFLALNFWLPVTEGMTWGARVLDAVFQSIATRAAGFTVVAISDLNPGTQIVYIVAMYISVYPVAISMRNSNVYQERSLGVFRGDDVDKMEFSDSDLRGPAPFIKLRRHPTVSSVVTHSRKLLSGPDFYVATQIQRQLSSDIVWVIAGVFAICIIESESIMSPSPLNMGSVIYECVSAFCNIGASMGYPGVSTSQAGVYHTLAKLVLILLMYRGRHRGLPNAIDRAVLLPSEELEQREVEDQILKRRNTSITNQSSLGNVMFYTRSSTL